MQQLSRVYTREVLEAQPATVIHSRPTRKRDELQKVEARNVEGQKERKDDRERSDIMKNLALCAVRYVVEDSKLGH